MKVSDGEGIATHTGPEKETSPVEQRARFIGDLRLGWACSVWSSSVSATG